MAVQINMQMINVPVHVYQTGRLKLHLPKYSSVVSMNYSRAVSRESLDEWITVPVVNQRKKSISALAILNYSPGMLWRRFK